MTTMKTVTIEQWERLTMRRAAMTAQQQIEINRLRAVVQEYQSRLSEGRRYLMTVDPQRINVEDTLYAFGWDKDGLAVRPE